MKVIFAQGNPGSEYIKNRHNVGFMALDLFASKHLLSWSDKSKFDAKIAETVVDKQKVILVKPNTFYNETGQSARKIIDFYNIDASDDLLVVHDDLALEIGTVRTRGKGSDAGNNGIKSINSHIGPDYHRVRIGIANELRERVGDSDFVLSNFNKSESDKLHDVILPHVLEIIDKFIDQKIEITSHKL